MIDDQRLALSPDLDDIVIVEVKTNQIKLNWEGESYAWIRPEEYKNYRILQGFDQVLKSFFEI